MIEYVTKWTEKQRKPYAQVYIFQNGKVRRRLAMHETRTLINEGHITDLKLIFWLNNYEASRKLRRSMFSSQKGIIMEDLKNQIAQETKPTPPKETKPLSTPKTNKLKPNSHELYKYLEGLYG
jgi:hypothetical protein